MAEIQAGSTVTIRRTMKDQAGAIIDISQASSKIFYLRLPEKGKVFTLNTEFTTNGTDGQHQVVTSVLNAPGVWILQARFTIAGLPFWSERQALPVRENIAP